MREELELQRQYLEQAQQMALMDHRTACIRFLGFDPAEYDARADETVKMTALAMGGDIYRQMGGCPRCALDPEDCGEHN